MKHPKLAHEVMRRKLWIKTSVATAGSSNCIHKESPGEFADKVLQDFDKKFPKEVDING